MRQPQSQAAQDRDDRGLWLKWTGMDPLHSMKGEPQIPSTTFMVPLVVIQDINDQYADAPVTYEAAAPMKLDNYLDNDIDEQIRYFVQIIRPMKQLHKKLLILHRVKGLKSNALRHAVKLPLNVIYTELKAAETDLERLVAENPYVQAGLTFLSKPVSETKKGAAKIVHVSDAEYRELPWRMSEAAIACMFLKYLDLHTKTLKNPRIKVKVRPETPNGLYGEKRIAAILRVPNEDAVDFRTFETHWNDYATVKRNANGEPLNITEEFQRQVYRDGRRTLKECKLKCLICWKQYHNCAKAYNYAKKAGITPGHRPVFTPKYQKNWYPAVDEVEPWSIQATVKRINVVEQKWKMKLDEKSSRHTRAIKLEPCVVRGKPLLRCIDRKEEYDTWYLERKTFNTWHMPMVA